LKILSTATAGVAGPPAGRARDLHDLARRIRRNTELSQIKLGEHLLHETVTNRLVEIHRTGGELPTGRPSTPSTPVAPTQIFIREGFMKGDQPASTESGRRPFVSQLISNGRGLQLRLALLMLFEAQCRLESDTPWTNVRTVKPSTGQRYRSWSELVVTHADGDPTRPGAVQPLRVRQVEDALVELGKKHVVDLPPPTRQRGRSRYDAFTLLDETGRTGARYVAPTRSWDAHPYLDSRFFTNGWIWALTDAEIAVYLMLADLRWRFPGKYANGGVFLTTGDRTDPFQYGITKTAYGSHDPLTRFYLIDRLSSSNRDYSTGRVRNYDKQWKGQHVDSHHFRINDDALDAQAFDSIEQVLVNPSQKDTMRTIGW
jgi:hypothetical protein